MSRTHSTPNTLDLDAALRSVVTDRAQRLVEFCCSTNQTIATAESLTGGAIAAALAVIPGAGDVLKGAAVTYRPETKHDVLGVRSGPVVTAAAAGEMARGAIMMFSSDLAVAVTGVAGPAPEEGVPVGTVFFAVADNDYRTVTRVNRFGGSPSDVRVATIRTAIELLDGFTRCRGATDAYQATSSQP